jgi:hypothetical protein
LPKDQNLHATLNGDSYVGWITLKGKVWCETKEGK